MGIIAALTADLQDINVFDTVAGTTTPSVSSSQARTGSYSYSLTGGSPTEPYVRKSVPIRADYYVGFAARTTDNTSNIIQLRFMEDSTTHITVSLAIDDLEVSCMNGTWQVITSALISESLSPKNKWQYFEVYAKVDDTVGQVIVKIGGRTVMTATGVDTRYSVGGVGQINTIQFRNPFILNSRIHYIDDVVIRDDDWPGRASLRVLAPTADGTDDSWSASTGSDKYAVCDDNPPNDYSDYISTDATVANTKQLFDPDTLSAGWLTAKSFVAVYNRATMDDIATENIRGIIYNGSTYTNGESTEVDEMGSSYASAFKEVTSMTSIETGVETL